MESKLPAKFEAVWLPDHEAEVAGVKTEPVAAIKTELTPGAGSDDEADLKSTQNFFDVEAEALEEIKTEIDIEENSILEESSEFIASSNCSRRFTTSPHIEAHVAAQTPYKSEGTKLKNGELVKEARGAVQLAKELATRQAEKAKEEVFAAFVASELKQITDIQINNETKWNIQTALMEGIKKQMQSSTRAPLVLPSTSSSSSNMLHEAFPCINDHEDTL